MAGVWLACVGAVQAADVEEAEELFNAGNYSECAQTAGAEIDGGDYRELPPNGGVDELLTLAKMRSRASRKPTLPSRASGQVRAQMKEREAKSPDLKWSGGRAGS